jgi:hypothetical protein
MLLKIGERLKKLKSLNLESVGIVGYSKQELSPNDFYLPHNLEELSIEIYRIYNMCSVPSTLTLIQHRSSDINDGLTHFQALKI